LSKGQSNPGGDVIAQVLAEKSRSGYFGAIQMGPRVQVTEIMSGTYSKAKFTFLHNGILGLQRGNTQQGGDKQLIDRAKTKFHGIDLRSNGYRTPKVANFL